jgi:hypothetical protein
MTPGQSRSRGRQQIEGERYREQFFSAEPVGQPAEKEGTADRATQITAASKPDLRIAQA